MSNSTNTIIRFDFGIGLNDKDTHHQRIQTVEAYKVVENVVSTYTDGATIYQSRGFYKGEWEESLQMTIFGIDRATALAICEDLKRILNQERIALGESEVKSELI